MPKARRGLLVIGPLAWWFPSFISPRRASAPLAHTGRGSRTGASALRVTAKQVRVDVVNVRPRAAPFFLALLAGPGGNAAPTSLALAVGTERDTVGIERHGVQVKLFQQPPALNLPCGWKSRGNPFGGFPFSTITVHRLSLASAKVTAEVFNSPSGSVFSLPIV